MSAPAAASGPSAGPSPWSPFRHRAFALLWSATLVSNIGTWMHDVGAGWLMTTLSPSPAIVALVQAATTLPIFLFALFAGALADRLDKRKMLITVNVLLLIVVTLLAVLTVLELVTPGILLLFTFLIGTGAAFMAPAWQSVVPSLVPKADLQPAIALNSMGINISRAIGPALAGFLITAVGLAAPFAVNAATFLFIIGALIAWTPPPRPAPKLPPEPIVGAMLTGLRHTSRNGPLKATMLRALGFFVFASAFWAMLPLIARAIPGGGAELYGLMLTSIGVGAVGGALLMPTIRKRTDANVLTAGGTVGIAVAMALLATLPAAPLAISAALLGGVSWIAVLTSLNVSAQTSLPNWVRARGLAIFLMVFFGAMSVGATLWGQVAAQTSISAALLIAGAGAIGAIPLTWRARLGQGEAMDLAPAAAWPAPIVGEGVNAAHDRGPVLVTIRYEIDPQQTDAFLAAVRVLSEERYRDGADRWGVYQDAADARVWLEWFFVPSWAEHLRQHDRVTTHDMAAHDAVRALHRGTEAPIVSHFLAPDGSTVS